MEPLVTGAYCELKIGEVVKIYAHKDGPRAAAKVIREATYEEWVTCCKEQGLSYDDVDWTRNPRFYAVYVD